MDVLYDSEKDRYVQLCFAVIEDGRLSDGFIVKDAETGNNFAYPLEDYGIKKYPPPHPLATDIIPEEQHSNLLRLEEFVRVTGIIFKKTPSKSQ